MPDDPTHDSTHLEPASETTPATPENLSPGLRVGRFVILGELGKGGMGVLYLAYDPELDRRVALKLFRTKAGRIPSDDRVRQLREAQALARLSHPNIVAVYDVGTFDDAVFLALEYIDGQNLEEWVAEQKPSVRQMSQTVVAAARGLLAAHRAGILHRDIKPENIMIGPHPRVRLVDFGLARAADAIERDISHQSRAELPSDDMVVPDGTILAGPDFRHITSGERPAIRRIASGERPGIRRIASGEHPGIRRIASGERPGSAALTSSVTLPGAVLGTPNFMAPELFGDSEANELSDLYALSASLYTLIYGRSPYEIKTFADFSKVGHETISFPPQGREQPVPSWIRKVLAKGMATDPKDRFQSAEELIAALEQDPAAVLKRRAAAGFLVTAAVATGAGLVSLSGVAEETCDSGRERVATVWSENDRSRLESGFLKLANPLAGATWPMVEHSLDEYTALWQDSFQDACEATYIRRDQSEELFDLRNQCLSDRLEKVGALIDVLAAVDQEMVEMAVRAVADLPSLVPCSKARQLRWADSPGVDPGAGSESRVDTKTEERLAEARASLAQAEAQYLAGQYTAAFQTAQSLLEPVDSGALPGLKTEILHHLGRASIQLGRYAEASAFLNRAMVAALAGHRDESAVRILADLAWMKGNFESQSADGLRWLDIAEALAKRLGKRPFLEAGLLRTRGGLTFHQGDYHTAVALFRRVLYLLENLDPRAGVGSMQIRSVQGATAMNLAVALEILGKSDESLVQYDNAIRWLSDVFGKSHPTVAEIRFNRAGALIELGKNEEAQAEIERSLQVLGATLGEDHPRLGIPLNNLGVTLEGQGRQSEAMALYQRALDIFRSAYPDGHLETSRALRNLAEVYAQREETERARELGEQALAMVRQVAGPQHPEIVGPLDLLARLDLAAGRYEEVVAAMRLALDLHGPDGNSIMRAGFLFYLARALGEGRIDLREARLRAEEARELLVAGGSRFQPQVEEIESWLEGL